MKANRMNRIKNIKLIYIISFNCRWPFEWKAPLGYFVAWLVQSAGLTVAILLSIIFFNLIFGSSWLFIFMAEDITNDLTVFNAYSETTEATENRAEKTKRFCVTIQLYSDTKQWERNFFSAILYGFPNKQYY